MDPNATLTQIRALAENEETFADTKGQIVSLFLSLDDWLSAGGFLPEAWQSSFHVSPEGNAAMKTMKVHR